MTKISRPTREKKGTFHYVITFLDNSSRAHIHTRGYEQWSAIIARPFLRSKKQRVCVSRMLLSLSLEYIFSLSILRSAIRFILRLTHTQRDTRARDAPNECDKLRTVHSECMRLRPGLDSPSFIGVWSVPSFSVSIFDNLSGFYARQARNRENYNAPLIGESILLIIIIINCNFANI